MFKEKLTLDNLGKEIKFPNLKVALWGAGEVFEKKIKSSFDGLGIKDVQIYDPDEDKIFPEYKKIIAPSETEKGRLVFILSPNSNHASQALELFKREIPFYLEKPCATNREEIEMLNKEVEKERIPVYFGDYYFFKALGLLSLMGVNLPFKDALILQKDKENRLESSLRTGIPVLGDIVEVKGYLVEGEGSAATIEKRQWLGDLKQGGGMLLDLMIHLTNISNLAGLKISSIRSVDLGFHTEARGEYRRIKKGDKNTAEDYAKAKGFILDDIPFVFSVGKYAKKNKRYLSFRDKEGFILRVDFVPGNPVKLISPEGEIGKIILPFDPYLLTLIHAIRHLKGKENKALFYEEQRISVLTVNKMQNLGRS